MAVIRITPPIKSQIINNAQTMFSSKIAAARESYPKGWENKVYNLLFSDDEISKVAALPTGWAGTTTQLNICGIIDDRNSPTRPVSPNIVLRYNNPVMVPKTYNLAAHGVRPHSVTEGIILMRDDPRWEELIAEIDAWTDRVSEVAKRRNDFVDGVSKLLDTFATIAPALKEWPPLWDLMSDSMKQTHRKIVERNSAEKLSRVSGVDIGSLTAQVVAHKMTKGE